MALPSLSPLSDELGTTGRPVLVPPPRGFRPLCGSPRSINLSTLEECAYARKRGSSVAKDAGLRYEAKIHTKLQKVFPTYLPEPQLEFIDDNGWRLIRPDAVLTLSHRTVVFEIKSQHMPEAWWQLTKLYAPVLAAGTKRPCQVVEIVRSYDPAMPFPCRVDLVDSLYAWVSRADTLTKFGVLPWRL